MPKKYASISFTPPQDVRAAARRGLEMRRKYKRGGLSNKEASKQGIGSGVQRATNLANGDTVSPETIGRMVSFFARHEKNKDSKTPGGEPGAGQIAWLLWGGDPGQRWAKKTKRQMEAADMKSKSLGQLASQIITIRSEASVIPQPLTYKSGGHTGAMIALFLPVSIGIHFIQSDPQALPPNELHVTLAYLGNAADISSRQIMGIHDLMKLISENHPPLTGHINGCGRFCNGDDDGDPFFIIPDLPALPNLRQAIIDGLNSHDIEGVSGHGFVPHITLTYLPHAECNPFDILERTPVTFPAISLVLGDDRYDYPLAHGGTPLSKADLIEKIGARHTGAECGTIQKIHDLAIELGAECHPLTRRAGARHSHADQGLVQRIHDDCAGLGATCKALPEKDRVYSSQVLKEGLGVTKHLSGKHRQKTHGGGKGKRTGDKGAKKPNAASIADGLPKNLGLMDRKKKAATIKQLSELSADELEKAFSANNKKLDNPKNDLELRNSLIFGKMLEDATKKRVKRLKAKADLVIVERGGPGSGRPKENGVQSSLGDLQSQQGRDKYITNLGSPLEWSNEKRTEVISTLKDNFSKEEIEDREASAKGKQKAAPKGSKRAANSGAFAAIFAEVLAGLSKKSFAAKAQSDAPNYRPTNTPQRCANCRFFRGDPGRDWCELFDFTADPDYISDAWEAQRPDEIPGYVANKANKADLAALTEGILILRGGRTSGNWGHVGRKGKRGGSGGGGGFGRIGVKPGSKPSRKKVQAAAKKKQAKAKAAPMATKKPKPTVKPKVTDKKPAAKPKAQPKAVAKKPAIKPAPAKKPAAKKRVAKEDKVPKVDKTATGDVKDAKATNHKQMSAKSENWYKNMNETQQDALLTYTSGEFRNINGGLRGQEKMTAANKKTVKNIDKALAKSSLDQDTVVFRGMDKEVLDKKFGPDIKKWVGKEYSDKGYTSTSVDPSGAFRGVQMEIRVPKGTKAGYLGSHPDNVFGKSEQELLLDKNQKFRVLKVRGGRNPKVLLEVVP